MAVIFVRDSLVWASLLLCLLFGGFSPYRIFPPEEASFLGPNYLEQVSYNSCEMLPCHPWYRRKAIAFCYMIPFLGKEEAVSVLNKSFALSVEGIIYQISALQSPSAFLFK